jgi:excisionase family DNA binding protein
MTADALLVTPEEAARRLSIARSSLYELVLTGEVASIKIGRSRRIPVDALTAYIGRKLRDGGLDK